MPKQWAQKTTFLGNGIPQSKTNASMMQIAGTADVLTSYGENACPCVGIDNLKGYAGATLDNYHVEYTLEAGASCDAWDKGVHPDCLEDPAPQWCHQKWCYVDPCTCNIEVLPKMTKMGLEYQGKSAYWSYATCGGMDLYTAQMSTDACVQNKDAASCSSDPKCGWDGKRCGGKELIETCASSSSLDATIYGEEDCRCVGIGGRGPGKAFMNVDEKTKAAYPPDVGSECKAWEQDVHPECKNGGGPSWCSSKWCYVDPCKCKTKAPPKAVMEANSHMRFQGKTAYWSYATCGSTDTWSTSGQGQYCVNQKTESECTAMKKCAWTGKECMGVALASICKEQAATGVLGMESQSGVDGLQPWGLLLLVLMVSKVA